MSTFNQKKEKEIIQTLAKHYGKNYSCSAHSFQTIGDTYFAFDLVCKSKSKSNEVVIIEIKTTSVIHDYNIRNFILSKNQYSILAPRYYMSRFYLCVDASASLTSRAKRLLDSKEIGLIRINANSVESVTEPESLENKLEKVLNSSLVISKECSEEQQIKKSRSDLIKKLGNEIRESTSQDIIPYKLRISSELIDKLENLSYLGYSSLLVDFGREYKNIKNPYDENNLILKTLGKLWEGKYGKVQGAKAFTSFERFEPILKDTPRYRDHMVHPFQVFLMGSLIIDSNYNFFKSIHKKFLNESVDDSLEFAWLLCSTFHDICYPIQKYEEINKNLFRAFLGSDSPPILFQAEKLLLEKDNLKYVDQLVSLFEHYSKKGNSWKFDSPCCIDHVLRSTLITEISKKNHGLLSAIALIKKTLSEPFVQEAFEQYRDGRFSSDIYPAALAIALHDEDVLKQINSKISIDNMPLCFLLIYCDLVQECGRSDGEEIVELHNFNQDKNHIESTLTFARRENFNNKIAEMERIYKIINSSSINFKLNIICYGSTHSEETIKNQEETV